MTTIVDLTPNDSVASILGRLSAAEGKRVALVAPPGFSLNAAEFRSVRRLAAARHIGLALITEDPALRSTADRLGVSSFRSDSRALRARWRRLRNEGAPEPVRPPSPGPVSPPFGAGLLARQSPTRFRPQSFERAFVRAGSGWWSSLLLLVVLLLLLGGLLMALLAVVPSATIIVVPAAERIQTTVQLTAVKDAPSDADRGIVAAQALSTQVSGEARAATTGRRFEPSTKSTGHVVLVNRTSGSLTVPSGTVVSTATGNNVRFETKLDAPLVGGARATVPVEALLPGPSGNVRAGTITRVEGPLALSVIASNEQPAAGGNVAQVGVVTEEDKERLEAVLFERLKEQAFARLNEELGASTFIPAESVSYLTLSPTFTPFVGEVADELALSMSVQAVGLVVDARLGDTIALARIQDLMPPGSRLISDTLRFIPGSVTVEDEGTVAFSVTAEGMLLKSTDESAIRTAVLGLAAGPATDALMSRFQFAEPAHIALGPDWLPYVVPVNLPSIPFRIAVKVDWDRAAQLASGEG